MLGIIFQENGTLKVLFELNVLPSDKEMTGLYKEAFKVAAIGRASQIEKEAFMEAKLLTGKEVATLWGDKTTDPVHSMAELPEGHPLKLRYIPGSPLDERRLRRFRLAMVIQWGIDMEDPNIQQRVHHFEYKPKRRRG